MEDELEQRAADYLSSVLGFNGERTDPVLGGYHLGNGYRLYSPSLRRFTSPDSMSPFGQGGINPYAYCEGDPINNTDPTGRSIASRVFGFFENVGELALGVVTDDPELIIEDTLRNEDKHLGTYSARQASLITTRPRTQSFSGATAHTRGSSFTRKITNFDHHLVDSNTIHSTNHRGSFFENRYGPGQWTFRDNRRQENAPYASEIARLQYNIVSQKNNFFGTMPKLIMRESVINKTTLNKTQNLRPKRLSHVFLNNTPNGKSTQHILEAFNLEAESVTREVTVYNNKKYIDFFIHIKDPFLN